MAVLWITCCALCIMNFDSFSYQVALIMMKLAFIDQEKPSRRNNRPGYLQWKWLAGFITLVFATSLNRIGEFYVSLVLASSTEATSIISGVILSIYWLDDKFYPMYDVPPLTIITVGCVTILCIATEPVPVYDFEILVTLLKSRETVIYLLLVGSFFALSAFLFYLVMQALASFEEKL
jgi:hypothetical protein